MYKKKISEYEKEIIELLKELSLMDSTLIHSIRGNILEEYAGYHTERNVWNIIKLYNDAIKSFHRIHTDFYSPGIYSFWGSGNNDSRGDYRNYLLSEMDAIVMHSINRGERIKLKEKIYNVAEEGLEKLIQTGIEINDFCLLHGDLYNGNILMYRDKYALIDFEFLRFGPPQIEWTFFLFWDVVNNNNPEIQKKLVLSLHQNITELKEKNILSDFDCFIMVYIFLPVILCVVVQYCEDGRYEKGEKIMQGIEMFWKNEYDTFRRKNIWKR